MDHQRRCCRTAAMPAIKMLCCGWCSHQSLWTASPTVSASMTMTSLAATSEMRRCNWLLLNCSSININRSPDLAHRGLVMVQYQYQVQTLLSKGHYFNNSALFHKCSIIPHQKFITTSKLSHYCIWPDIPNVIHGHINKWQYLINTTKQDTVTMED